MGQFLPYIFGLQKVMLNSLYNYSQDRHLQFEAEAGLAVQRALAEMKKEKKPRYVIEE